MIMINYTVSIKDESKVQQILDLLRGFPCVEILNQEKQEQSLDEQLIAAIKKKNIPNITLPADENGHAYIDKELHPKLYDWAVNG